MPYKPETRSIKSNSEGKVLIFIQYNNPLDDKRAWRLTRNWTDKNDVK